MIWSVKSPVHIKRKDETGSARLFFVGYHTAIISDPAEGGAKSKAARHIALEQPDAIPVFPSRQSASPFYS